ncbi:MAG: phosphoglycerate kinase [Candidatus Omnitrophica bacterium CG08_land_8_20_14_0_20_41_16]|nr:MAG: phosphoglycerate kinase [Candidatus Omnitrophica bacterium CG08_land_8_20_14_0_20_41_16]
MWRKISSILVSLCLVFQQLGFASIATELNLAGHLSRMSGGFVQDRFRPVHIRFFSYDALNDNIKVMLDKGDVKELKGDQFNASTKELLNYFLVGINLPSDKFWVNLRPDSQDNIIDDYLARTDVGKIMLETDLQLKKDTAQFTSPETPEGKEYWNRLYQKAEELYGYQEVTIPTLTRPWIVPNEIIVRQTKDSAYIYKATLKVMLEQDFLKDSSVYNFKDERAKTLNEYSSQLIRELIIPKLTKEVNLSKRYASLRQVYYSIILSRWFKSHFTGQAGKYASRIDRKDLTGLTSVAVWSKSTYFEAYKKSFAQGEYNIKETVRTPTGQVIRSYFSGGQVLTGQELDAATQGVSFLDRAASSIAGSLVLAGLTTPPGMDMPGQVSSPVSIKVRVINDLVTVVKAKGIDSGMLAADWNVPLKEGRIDDPEKIEASTEAIINLFDNVGLKYIYAMTHAGRPDPKKGYEKESSLEPMVESARDFLAKKGLKDVEIVLLPFDLAQAEKTIQESKAKFSDKRIMFVLENIRFYRAEQLKADKKAKEKDNAQLMAEKKAFEEQLVSLTGRTVNNLVYVNEAFDKAHRGEDSSIRMAWLFPEENRAAGFKFAKDSQAVLDFQAKVLGRLSAMFGGKKFDKYASFGNLSKAIQASAGTLMIVGAQANPYLKDQGNEIGKSIMPSKEADIKSVSGGIEKIKASKVNVLLPKDFVVLGKDSSVKLEDITLEDSQIDIGDESAQEIVAYIKSLKAGDGLILNGGAGVFDKAKEKGGSSKGTIEIVLAANEAAKIGVAVFFAGGDMNNALNVVEKATPGFKLDESVRTSTAGGALLEALTQGVANLAAVRAMLKMDTAESLFGIHSVIKNAFPGAMVLPTISTLSEDTSIDASGAYRQAALDLFRKNGIYVAVPDGTFADQAKLMYGYMVMPIAILAENVPAELKEKLAAAKDEKAATLAVQEYLKSRLTEQGINIADKQMRSSLLDAGKLGAAAVDIPSLIAIKTDTNDLLIQIPIWAKKDYRAVESLNEKINSDFEALKPSLVNLIKEELSWPKESIDISTPEASLNALSKYAPLFFDELSKGVLTHVSLLSNIVRNIEPQAIVQAEGIKYDSLLNSFVSSKDQEGKIPGFGKNLESFLGSINNMQQLSWLLYLLVTPTVDVNAQAGVAVDNRELQDAVIGFYGRSYRHLLSLAQESFNDPMVFEPLRAEIGNYAQKLNKAIRAQGALEINGANPEALINYLSKKGVNLSQAEKDNINRVYASLGSNFAYDILQFAGILSEANFISIFRNLKVENPKIVLPSQKPYEVDDGTGRIGRLALAFRLASDINAQEPGYLGRYLVRTREIKGATQEEKFAAALASTIAMFSDAVIKDSGLGIRTQGGVLIPIAELIANKRLSFEAGTKVLTAQLDFQTQAQISSVYPVDILLDNKKVGRVYFADIASFNSRLKAELQKEGASLDNIPRPAIIQEEGKSYYFGISIDAIPGGVEIGDQALNKAYNDKLVKLDGPTLWSMVAKDNLGFSSEKLGDAPEELIRLKEILGQIENSRLPKGQKDELFIYLKAQIPKKLLLPLGGSINVAGKYLQKLPMIKPSGAVYINPTSCSTNGGFYEALALSTLFGGFGRRQLAILGLTLHMYTTGDKKGIYGDFNPKSTGAAKGVKQHLALTTLFTALRTPTAYVDGATDIVGGSIFDLLIQLPDNVSQELVRNYLIRVGLEYPEILRVFNPSDKVNDRYRWKDTITGLRTGSILYEDFIEQVLGNIYRMPVGYDNEMSYSFKMNEMKEQLLLVLSRQKSIGALMQAAPLANTAIAVSSAIEFTVVDVVPSQTTTLGAPTLRVDIQLKGGAKGHFVIPAGTSTGEGEAKTIMQDVGFEQVAKNVRLVNEEAARLGLGADQVVEIAKLMLSMGKDKLGAETTLGYQMPSAWAAASQMGLEPYEFIRLLAPDLASKGVPKTKIQYNITNGGQHAENSLDMQEFMVVPIGKTTAEGNMMNDNIDRQLGLIYQALGLKADPNDKGVGKLRGKEGGYKIEDLTMGRLKEIYQKANSYNIPNLDIPALRDQGIGVHEFVLNCKIAAIKNSGYEPSTAGKVGTVALALDPAATSMLVEGHENLYNYEGRQITSKELAGIYASWAKKYPIDSIEDGVAENDWDGLLDLVEAVGDKVMVVVDDNTVSQASLLLKFINLLKKRGFIGKDGKVTKRIGILIKLNQNGFLTTGIDDPAQGYQGTLEVIRIAKEHGIEWIVSHRSKEAEPEENEVSIAEVAAGTNAYGLKSGDHVQAIRAVKEDRLAAIDARERLAASSAVKAPSGIDASKSSASIPNKEVGGIDFRPAAMPIIYQPMGNFASLNPKLPVLSKAELAVFDIDKELSGIEKLVDSQIVPSGERIKELLAACSQKGEFEGRREQLMALLVKMGILEETQCCLQEASQGYKEALVLADSLV